MNIIKELIINNFPKNNTPIIRIFDNGISYLLIDEWPLENDNRFSEWEIENIEKILTEIVQVEVVQEDRDRFVIFSNDIKVLNELNFFLENKKNN